jgi:uncharacterized membrane protein
MDENTKEEKSVEPINVNVEIDYDKLATAIVKAQKTAEVIEKPATTDMVQTEQPKEKLKWWQKFNKKIQNNLEPQLAKLKKDSIITKIFSVLIGIVFIVVGVGLMFLSPDIIKMYRVEYIYFLGNFIGTIYYYATFVISEMVAILLFLATFEIMYTRNRQFIISVFSALTSLVALIVAIIALFK